MCSNACSCKVLLLQPKYHNRSFPKRYFGAGILCNDQTIFDLLCYSRSVLHSSSPSYLTMASIDNAICRMQGNCNTHGCAVCQHQSIFCAVCFCNVFGKVKDICKLQNTSAVVIVDASHGSHFAFCKNLPQLDTQVADITILSCYYCNQNIIIGHFQKDILLFKLVCNAFSVQALCTNAEACLDSEIIDFLLTTKCEIFGLINGKIPVYKS